MAAGAIFIADVSPFSKCRVKLNFGCMKNLL